MIAKNHYRPVHTRVWGDRKFIELSEDGRALWLCLLTAPTPTPIPGLLVTDRAGLAALLRWPLERLGKALVEALGKGLDIRFGERLVWLPKSLKHQPPASPNQIKFWATGWEELPESDLKQEVWEALEIACKKWSDTFYKAFAEPLGGGLGKGYRKGYPKGSPKQEQEQKQDQSVCAPGDLVTPPPPSDTAEPDTHGLASPSPPESILTPGGDNHPTEAPNDGHGQTSDLPDDASNLAEYLHEFVCLNHPKGVTARAAALKRHKQLIGWAKDFRKFLTETELSYEDAEGYVRFSQQSKHWRNVAINPAALIAHWDQVVADSARATTATRKPPGAAQETPEQVKARRAREREREEAENASRRALDAAAAAERAEVSAMVAELGAKLKVPA